MKTINLISKISSLSLRQVGEVPNTVAEIKLLGNISDFSKTGGTYTVKHPFKIVICHNNINLGIECRYPETLEDAKAALLDFGVEIVRNS